MVRLLCNMWYGAQLQANAKILTIGSSMKVESIAEWLPLEHSA